MKLFGIIGFPLTHSFSKQYFNEKIEAEGIADVAFESYPLLSITELPQLLQANQMLLGLAVTIPYKEQVLNYVTVQSDEVKAIGAANCIKINGGQLTAFNTDIIGFERSFTTKLQPGHKKALVLGTGGASKAVQYVLNKLGIEFLIVSRKHDPAANTITYKQVTAAVMQDYTIIINATPLGMSPNENSLPDLPYTCLTPNHYLYDLVYKPAKTLFLQKGVEQGATIQNGYDMLILQAGENWKIWNSE